jgi:hypothetical protein
MYVRLNINDDFPLNSVKENLYPKFIIDTNTNLKYYSIDEFQKRKNVSESTVRRLISKAKNNISDRCFLLFHGKYYIKLNLGVKAVNGKNLREYYSNYLKIYDWKILGSVNYNEHLNLHQIRKSATKYFEFLKNKFPCENFTFFFASEKNSDREGYHFHFLLDFINYNNFNLINDASNRYFGNNRTKKLKASFFYEAFDSEKDGIGYSLKKIELVKDGYDLYLS